MSETSMICPQCGQKDTSNAKLAYCSFCYTRFKEPESTQSEPQEPKEANETTEVHKDDTAESEQTDNPVEESAPESAVPTPKEIVYTDVICPFCRARTPHEAIICPECERDLTGSWL